jgi:hypothetical protein
MNKVSISVLREVVTCTKCHKQNVSYNLSDFAYGQRLYTYDNGRQYAFINLIDDEIYNTYKEMLTNTIKKNSLEIEKDKLLNTLNDTFIITFDKIDGFVINNVGRRRCDFCSSFDFSDLIDEPVTLVNIEAALITHEDWISLTYDEKIDKIEQKLKRIGMIYTS